MTQDELRIECLRLLKCDNISDSKDLIDIYLEYIFSVIVNHQKDKVTTLAEKDAKIINQMIFTKIAHIKQIIKGISFHSKNDTILKNIIDPTFIGVLIRNVYETVAMFNLVNITTKTAEEKTILYNLWVISGLKYRQKFSSIVNNEENTNKLNHEKQQIKNFTKQIEDTTLYKNMTEKNQKKILEKIKQKDYKIQFNNNNIEYLDWQDLIPVMGIKNSIMGEMYTYFSLYSHPSNVSVFQFEKLFSKNEEHFITLTNFQLKNAFFLISVFIADYVKLFPNVINTYNSLSIRDQIVINWINIMARDDTYSINDVIKTL